VIVFVPYTHALDGVSKRLTEESIEHGVVSGKTSRREREKLFGLFQNTDRIKVLAAHPATMSHGLTLTAADTIVWFAPYTSLETYEQANARIRRVGQKHKQQILMFQGTPAERKVYARLRAKKKVQDKILDLFLEE
jgi:SNF2 family DNA or RNA helicase